MLPTAPSAPTQSLSLASAGRTVAYSLAGFVVGCIGSWLLMLATFYIPGFRDAVFLSTFLPIPVAGLVARALWHRQRAFGIAVLVASVVTCVFILWLFTTLPGPDF